MVSNIKAELVRNNIVTRNDLIKLYQPPKKVILPVNNPFFTRTLVNREPTSQQTATRNRYKLIDKDEIAGSIGY